MAGGFVDTLKQWVAIQEVLQPLQQWVFMARGFADTLKQWVVMLWEKFWQIH